MNNTALILQSVLRHRIMNSITEMRISTTQFNEETGINPEKIATNLRNLILERVELNEGFMDAAKAVGRGVGAGAKAVGRGIRHVASGRSDTANAIGRGVGAGARAVGGAVGAGGKKVGGALGQGIKDIWSGHKKRQEGNRIHALAKADQANKHEVNKNKHALAMRQTDNDRLKTRDQFAAQNSRSSP